MAAGESKKAGYDEILLAVVDRLIEKLGAACNKSTCYLSLDPDQLPSNPGTHVFVVAPNSGEFDRGSFVGGGLNHLDTHSGCLVAIHSPSLTDQAKRDAIAITDETRGLIRRASAVIAALSNTGAGPVAGDAWVPTHEDGYGMTSPFTPLTYSLRRHPNDAVRSIEIAFGFDFDWDVTRQ